MKMIEKFTMLTRMAKFSIAAVATTLITILVTQIYTHYCPTGEEDAKQALAEHQRELISLLTDISQKLSREKSYAGIKNTPEVDSTPRPNKTPNKIDVTKLKIKHELPEEYRRAFLVGAPLYKTKISITGISESSIPLNMFDYVEWDFGVGRVRKNVTDTLYMSKINTTLDIKAKIVFKTNIKTGIIYHEPIDIDSKIIVE